MKKQVLHKHPDNVEKHMYLDHKQHVLTLFSILSFFGLFVSSYRFFGTDPILHIFYPVLAATSVYYLVSLLTQGFGKKFSAEDHFNLVKSWRPKKYPSLDIFLPVCGEDINIIQNTWFGVKAVAKKYKGKVDVYVLDDGDSSQVKNLASKFGYNYLVRDNRGHFKKSGNLRHGFLNSSNEYIAIFDADFKPRPDFVNEVMPYFFKDEKLGIVQTPQYFKVHRKQNWLERGAGAVQEYFYRSIQQNRQTHNGAICVGSNAIYKREALLSNGGTTLIEHSEDVHTGFDLKKQGWGLLYIPVVLATGTCPNGIMSFFKQQYRWCRGSMSLLGSKKFWNTKIPFMTRLCFISGFMYYIHTAFVMTFILPLIPLSLLYIVPEQARILNYVILLPTFLYTAVVFPLWHKTKYGFETESVKMLYGWAHFFAIIDSLRGHGMEWSPTGSEHSKSLHFDVFVKLFTAYSLTAALLWVGAAFWYLTHWSVADFAPVFITGLLYLANVVRIIVKALKIDRFIRSKIRQNINMHKYSDFLEAIVN